MLSLKEFQDQLRWTVKGQNEAIKVVTTCIYKYLLKKTANMDYGASFNNGTTLLLTGPSGSGKTFIITEAAKLMTIPFIQINAKSICQEGWHGNSFVQLIESQIEEYKQGRENYQYRGIIFIDEFDKLIMENGSSSNDKYSLHLQASLLKYIDGLSTNHVAFKDCLFIFAGAFSDLKKEQQAVKADIGFYSIIDLNKDNKKLIMQQLIKYGLLDELAGRIQEYCQLEDITEQTYNDLYNSDRFFKASWMNLFQRLQIIPNLDKDKLINIAKESNLGVRGLIQAIEMEITIIINQHIDKIDLDRLSPFHCEPTLSELEQTELERKFYRPGV